MSNGKRRQRRRHKIVTWVLGGATFVMVIATANGCGMFGQRTSSSRGPVTAAGDADPLLLQDPADASTPTTVPSFVAVTVEPPAPSINIFGEFDGVKRTAAKTGSEAGFEQHTYVEEGYDGDVSVCPAGQWIVFSSTRHSERTDIYMQRVGGVSVTQLTSDWSDDAFPTFSPDGQRIAFCSTRSGTWDIFVMDVDGKNVIQVTSGPSQDIHPTFSPDGNRLAYSSIGSRSGQWELWTVDLATNQKKMIGFGLFPSWSPDRSCDRIAFQRARARGSRWFSLWTIDLVDGEARNMTEVAVSTNAAIVSPVWSPDGQKLAFSTIVEPARSDGAKPVGQQDIWTVNADGTNRQRITDGNGTNATPYWASDGRIYFVSDRGGTDCIWSARADSASTGFAAKKKESDAAKREAVGSTDAKELPQ